MSTEVPDHLAVPPSWVHVDLQKLRTRLEIHNTAERLNQLKLYQGAIASQVSDLEKSTTKRQRRLERLTMELQELTTEQDAELGLHDRGRRVLDGTRNQVYYQKGTSRNYLVPCSSSSPAADPLESPCPLSLYGFSVFYNCVGDCARPQEDSVAAFLKLCAPLFQWSAEELLVKPPFFFDEPCLLECSAEEAAAMSSSSHSPSPSSLTMKDPPLPTECRNAACAYWHRDQLAHMRVIVQFCVAALRGMCVKDERLCCVRRLTSRLSRQAHEAESVSVVCALVCEVLQTLIGLGLHVHLVKGGELAPAMGAPAVNAADVEHTGPPRGDLMCDVVEKQRWSELMRRHAQSPSALMSSMAAELFQVHCDALSWRCLLACVPDAAQRQWLARQGIQLFPSCPQLHLEYVLSSMKSAATLEQVMEAGQSSCRTLSAQAAAAVVAGLDLGQYGTTVARHVGYIITVVFVHCAKTDAGAALLFLQPFLSTDAEAALAVLLSPIARQNLAIMSVALRRAGHLRGVEHLPLAAVSEQVMELASPDGANPTENGRDVIYASLKLINAYRRDHFELQLTTACAGALQLSLLRTFSHRLSYLERVAEKTVPQSALSQGVIYCAYVSTIAQQQSVPAAVQVAESLAAAEGATCFLNLLLLSQMRTWGCTSQLSAAQAVAQLCASEQLPAETLDSAERVREAAAKRTDVSAVEWVAAYALHMRCGEAAATTVEEQWTAMQHFPMEVLAQDTMAAGLYFSLVLQLSGACRNAAKFYATVHRCLGFFLGVHTHTWSPLDDAYAELVGLPHYVTLLVYEDVPLLLGSAAKETYEWRCLVLAAATELGVVHPLLMADASTA
ncbi:hypothetical protein ABB37_02011 [Leptomonas pyrrhocoris]|uniref:Uncharacterized protein n=1 Tax=Leptomonas pyrrhocoris TaxID=157538 RepID=A0A0N0DY65_LEPPY|nr:hypothetical protein ABB37_02011 [Leptomonas pyrrhocoris]KPA83788.1 hypothetical protein ABB37_02011 [Leptomonas pyrrhocoris]|eukprot:XP_015662227.1 hypothetical protein ABB37_02011 [Leptomonas pyrrhocoris]